MIPAYCAAMPEVLGELGTGKCGSLVEANIYSGE